MKLLKSFDNKTNTNYLLYDNRVFFQDSDLFLQVKDIIGKSTHKLLLDFENSHINLFHLYNNNLIVINSDGLYTDINSDSFEKQSVENDYFVFSNYCRKRYILKTKLINGVEENSRLFDLQNNSFLNISYKGTVKDYTVTNNNVYFIGFDNYLYQKNINNNLEDNSFKLDGMSKILQTNNDFTTVQVFNKGIAHINIKNKQELKTNYSLFDKIIQHRAINFHYCDSDDSYVYIGMGQRIKVDAKTLELLYYKHDEYEMGFLKNVNLNDNIYFIGNTDSVSNYIGVFDTKEMEIIDRQLIDQDLLKGGMLYYIQANEKYISVSTTKGNIYVYENSCS